MQTKNLTQVFKRVGGVYVGYVQELLEVTPLTGSSLSSVRARLSRQLAAYLKQSHPHERFFITGMLLFSSVEKAAVAGTQA